MGTGYIDGSDGTWMKFIKREHHRVPLVALTPSTINLMCEFLDVEMRSLDSGLQADYRGLATEVGFNFLKIELLSREVSPTAVLIRLWREGEHVNQTPTIGNLVQALMKLQRFDLLMECKDNICSNAQEYHKEQSSFTHPLPGTEHSRPALTVDDYNGMSYYDAFVCYNDESEEDAQFVKKMTDKLEKAPFNLKLYLPARNGLLGVNMYDTDAKVIHERCAHIIVVLSRYYFDSETCVFQASIAVGSFGNSVDRHIVPVVIDEQCRMPNILNIKRGLDFLDKNVCETKWLKLARSVSRYSTSLPSHNI